MKSYDLRICILLLSLIQIGCMKKTYEKKTFTSETFHAITMNSKKSGFLLGYGTGKLYTTKNKWNSLDSLTLDKVYYEHIDFIDVKRGWLCGENGKVFKTDDGGTHWQDVSLNINEKVLLYGLYIKTEKEVFVCGGKLVNNKWEGTVWKTINNGKTWIEVITKLPFLIKIKLLENNRFLLAGSNYVGTLEEKNHIILFNDTTQKVGTIRDIEFTKNKLVAVSQNGYIICSSDYGKTWKQKQLTSNRLRCIKKISKKHWLIAGDKNQTNDNLFVSKDNGMSWTVLLNNMPDVHSVYLTKRTVFFAGKNGLLTNILLKKLINFKSDNLNEIFDLQ